MLKLVKKSNSKKLKKVISGLFMLIFGTLLVFSLYKIHIWQKDSGEVRQIANQIAELKSSNSDNNNMIDFAKLNSINSDTVAWLSVPGTNVDYPVVQAKNNEYYLNRSFEKRYNQAGWIFADYRNNFRVLDKNNLIYGHGRVNGMMFSTLKNVLKNEWHTNQENHLITLITPTKQTKWEVFSVYRIDTTSDYLSVSFNNDKEFADFLKLIKERSVYDFGNSPVITDKVLTLSTCQNRSVKIVLHAKLTEEVASP